MKIQLNTVEDVERFVDGNPLLVDAIKQEVVRGFDKPYIKPLDNSQEARQIRRELRETLRKKDLFTNDLVKEGLCHAIESDVKTLLENEAFVKETEGLVILDESFTEEDYAIIVSKENDELLEKINKALANLKESGKLDEIVAKYIKADE